MKSRQLLPCVGDCDSSGDITVTSQAAKRIRTGTLNINSAFNIQNLPFGGFKESGIGREGGRWGLDEYTEIQSLTWR